MLAQATLLLTVSAALVLTEGSMSPYLTPPADLITHDPLRSRVRDDAPLPISGLIPARLVSKTAHSIRTNGKVVLHPQGLPMGPTSLSFKRPATNIIPHSSPPLVVKHPAGHPPPPTLHVPSFHRVPSSHRPPGPGFKPSPPVHAPVHPGPNFKVSTAINVHPSPVVPVHPAPFVPVRPAPHLQVKPAPHVPVQPDPHVQVQPAPHVPVQPAPHVPVYPGPNSKPHSASEAHLAPVHPAPSFQDHPSSSFKDHPAPSFQSNPFDGSKHQDLPLSSLQQQGYDPYTYEHPYSDSEAHFPKKGYNVVKELSANPEDQIRPQVFPGSGYDLGPYFDDFPSFGYFDSAPKYTAEHGLVDEPVGPPLSRGDIEHVKFEIPILKELMAH